ncbi:hypothetical protein [Nocardia sp. NPDC049707]|uniref:hypothetical protein n=1 Tax=Nocardia sp. NPDC049707 TaxID=3154735 RepID=UPI00342C7B59
MKGEDQELFSAPSSMAARFSGAARANWRKAALQRIQWRSSGLASGEINLYIKRLIAGSVIATALSTGIAAPHAMAAPVSEPATSVLFAAPSDSLVALGDVRAGKPQNAELSKEEQEAVDSKNAGKPYDQAAYNRAMQKIKQAEKYDGCRNKQKRKSC